MKNEDPWKMRPEYHAIQVNLLDCTPANFDHAKGEPASVVTIARKDLIEPLVFNVKDTQTLVARLLVSLATYHDEFAQKLLDSHFPSDDDGNFQWPRS